MTRAVVVGTLVLGIAVLLLNVFISGDNRDEIYVEDFDRVEVLRFQEHIIKTTEWRNSLIEMLARRYNVNLDKYDYAIQEGKFFLRGAQNETDQ